MYNKRQIFTAISEQQELLGKDIGRFVDNRSHPFIARQIKLLQQQAEQYGKSSPPGLPYHKFKLYWETGDREQFQQLYFEKRGRLLTFSLLSFLYPNNTDYLTRLEDTIWDICGEPFWCVPAHFMDTEDIDIPFDQYADQLDLFSCETGFALAEALELNRTRLSSKVVQQAELQVTKRIFDPFLDGHTLYRFEKMENNWSSVCGCAIGGAALYLLRDKAALTSILHRVLSCVDVYLNSFGEDGVCIEGVAYWTYGFGFYICFADLLAKKTEGRLDLFSLPKTHAIAKAQQLYYIDGNQTISFSDGSDTETFRIGISTYLKKRYPEVELPELQYAKEILDDSCHRFCLSLRDLLWFDPTLQYGISPNNSQYLPDAQWFISKHNGISLFAKAGHNGESHNHNDCGSFIFYKQNRPILYDLGAGLYTAQYFSSQRYEIFVNSSLSHNVAIVNDQPQIFGKEHTTKNVVCSFTNTCDSFGVDLQDCYSCPALCSYSRKLIHQKDKGIINLCDTFSFTEPGQVTEVFVTKQPIELHDGYAILHDGDVRTKLSFDSELLQAEVLEQQYDNHENKRETAYLLHLISCTKALSVECSIIID